MADFGIVVPVGPGNRPWLKATLESLRIQKPTCAVAICAVEDSPALQRFLADYADMITYTRIGPDGGQSDAINEGWSALSAQYYGWLNDDDILHPDAMQIAAHLFEDTNADVVQGRSDILEKGELRVGYGGELLNDRLLRENPIAQPSTFVTRAALLKICSGPNLTPVNPDLHYAMDWDLWQRLYLSGAKFESVSSPLSITRWYTDTKTATASLRKYREYAALLGQSGGWVRRVWTLTNVVIHNQATYGRIQRPFRLIAKALQSRQSNKATSPTSEPGVEVYHYEPTPLHIRDAGVIDQNLGAGIVLKTAAPRVSLKPIKQKT